MADTAAEEIWRYSRIGELDLDRFRPADPSRSVSPVPSPRPAVGRSRPRRASAPGSSSCATAGSSTTSSTSSSPPRASCVCGLATCERDRRRVGARHLLGRVTRTRSPCCTTRSSPGGAFIKVPAGVVVEKPIIVLHWSEGDGLATFPHTLVVAEESSEVTVLDRFGSPDVRGDHHLVDAVVELVVGDNARAALPVGAGARPAHLADRAPARPCRSRRVAALVGGRARRRLRPAAQRVAADSATAPRATCMAVYFGDHAQMLDFRTLQDHDAPNTRSDLLFKGAVEDEAHSVYSRPHPAPPRGAQGGGEPDEPQPRAHARAQVPSRSRTSRSRPTTSAAPTPARSARSTTSSCTTWRAGACRPTKPSGSSSSASSTTSSSGCRCRRSGRRCAARSSRRSEHRRGDRRRG